jgi:hypothetical protein
MQAASTYLSSPSWSARHVTDYRFRPAATVAKDDLLELRTDLARDGDAVPEWLDALIRNFETASDRHGMMSFDHFRGFAARTGLLRGARAS